MSDLSDEVLDPKALEAAARAYLRNLDFDPDFVGLIPGAEIWWKHEAKQLAVAISAYKTVEVAVKGIDRAIEELCMLGENAFRDDPKRSFGAIAEAVFLLRSALSPAPPQSNVLREAAKSVVKAYDDWSGHEPSTSVLERAIDVDLRAALKLSEPTL